jgi:hypothetical protein
MRGENFAEIAQVAIHRCWSGRVARGSRMAPAIGAARAVLAAAAPVMTFRYLARRHAAAV